jgi:hypothetical protein
MINYIQDTLNKTISLFTMGPLFRQCGLSYKPTKSQQNKKGEYRMDLMQDYIIEFNELFYLVILIMMITTNFRPALRTRLTAIRIMADATRGLIKSLP